jgi:mannose-6-phosphate isomerase class I
MVMNNSVNENNSTASNMNMNMNMHTMNASSNTMKQYGHERSDDYSLVNLSDYQSAQALTVKASEIFNNKLKSTNTNNNNVTAFITNLENGLSQLNDLIAKKDSPMDVMMVVHTKIHPNLLGAFSLQLR